MIKPLNGKPAVPAAKPVLITGGAGFIGSNLAERLAESGRDVLIYDALARAGVEENLAWLKQRHPQRVSSVIADIRDRAALSDAVADASAVFHFAAQVAVTSSLVDPRHDFEVNLGGTMNLLEALRRNPVPLLYSSTNKVYGDLGDIPLQLEDDAYRPVDPEIARRGIGENRPLDFHTPYGCSKGGADQYVLDYARSFGIPAAVMRMSCIYGERQFGTEDQGWVAHFLIRALKGEPITLYGDGFQVRDILYVGDAVDAYLAASAEIGKVSGQAFNLGGGPSNAISLVKLLGHIEAVIGRKVETAHEPWRQGDQRYFVADTRKVRQALGLAQPLDWRPGVARLADWLSRERPELSARPLERVSAMALTMEARP